MLFSWEGRARLGSNSNAKNTMEWQTGRLVLARGQFSCLSSWQCARPHFAFLSSASGWSEEGPYDLWGPSKSTQRIYEFVIPSQLVDSIPQKHKTGGGEIYFQRYPRCRKELANHFSLLKEVGKPQVFAVWDTLHTYPETLPDDGKRIKTQFLQDRLQRDQPEWSKEALSTAAPSKQPISTEGGNLATTTPPQKSTL